MGEGGGGWAISCCAACKSRGRAPSAYLESVAALLVVQNQEVPSHLLKTENQPNQINRILIYNTYFGVQQSIMILDKGV